MKKLAIISSQAFSLVNFRGSLICELVSSGVFVYALAPDFDAKMRSEIRELGAVPVDYQLSRTGVNPLSDMLDTLRLIRLLRSLKPDITLGYFIKPVIYGTLAAWLAGVPKRFSMIEGLGYVFIPEQGPESVKRRLLRSLVARLYRLSLSHAEKVIFLNSDDIQEFCHLRIILPEQAVRLGGIGVDLKEWCPAPLVLSPITFLLTARLLREKGILEFVAAARRVKQRYHGVRFILLGGVDSNPGGLAEGEIQGWVDEGLLDWPGHTLVRPWLEQSSVFVLPSYREGIPRSTQEAMAMGRPVITTDVPGCRETVVNGLNGFMIPPRNVEALEQAMERFILEPELIERMGRESRRLAEEHFDVCKANHKLMTVLGLV